MNELDIINRHIEIEETLGYDILKGLGPISAIGVYQFARIIWNYKEMIKLLNHE